MLAKASLTTPLCCLRCELRHIISRRPLLVPSRCAAAIRSASVREFKTSTVCYKGDAGEDEAAFLRSSKSHDKKKEMYRRQYPLGRIVGKPGRRQRERSETLRTPAMQKPFDVVLLQDVKISEEPGGPASSDLGKHPNGGPVASSIPSLDEQPTQEEVNASIAELRPESHTIDQRTFDELCKQMLQSYTYGQLSSYLKQFSSPSVSNATSPKVRGTSSSEEDIRRSDWRPGQTSLEVRHFDDQPQHKSRTRRSRTKVVHEILRSAWKLTAADEGQIGELEMGLNRWQRRLLFVMDRHNRSNYEQMIQSPFLLRNSKLQYHPTDNAVRITARRGVAEQIASLIENKLRETGRTDLSFSAFGRASRDFLYLRMSSFVERYTMSIIERGDGNMLRIYARSEFDRQHARRILLSLLHLAHPSQISQIEASRIAGPNDRKVAAREWQPILERNTSDLHVRDRRRSLARLVKPTSKSTKKDAITIGGQAGDQHEQLAVRLATDLDFRHIQPGPLSKILESMRQSDMHGTYWKAMTDQSTSPWEAQLCRILHKSAEPKAGKAARTPKSKIHVDAEQKRQSVVQSHLPGMNALLSHFAPKEPAFAFDEPSSLPPVLIAHFYPSPLTSRVVATMHQLPRIELRYDLVEGLSKNDLTVRLSSMQATLAEEDVRIQLPAEAADLRFVRRTLLEGKLDQVLIDDEIQRFTGGLQQSLWRDGELVGEAMIKIKLPALAVADEAGKNESSVSSGAVEVEYLFERFEQVQIAEFGPVRVEERSGMLDGGIQQAMDAMKGDILLQYRTSEGGIIGGSRTELAIVNRTAHTGPGDAGRKQKHGSLVKTALELIGCLTRINAGHLGPHMPPEAEEVK